MHISLPLTGVVFVCAPIWAASIPQGDARRGAELFTRQGCIHCHSVQGKGARSAPDLGRRLDREYTPAGIASRMWNHAPTMWSAMGKESMAMPSFSESDSADLFAFFYSVRYFEKPGDAARGKRAFEGKGCAGCHSIAAGSGSIGTPIAEWQSLGDSIELIQRMWIHGPKMRAAMAAKNLRWPELSSQELTDVLVYLQNLPPHRGQTYRFALPSSENGKALMESKGCTGCHKGDLALEPRLEGKTLTDVAASMWNHAPKMMDKVVDISPDEMRQIFGYVWSTSFFRPQGNPAKGERLFTSKRCAGCHNEPAGQTPGLRSGGNYSAVSMVSALWKHGPRMLTEMEKKAVRWPVLNPNDMADLLAYLEVRK